jgi:hypothetical protein
MSQEFLKAFFKERKKFFFFFFFAKGIFDFKVLESNGK